MNSHAASELVTWVSALLLVTLCDLTVGLADSASEERSCSPSEERSWPYVLFIAVDDLNDWVGCLGGHPQASTPNINCLADQRVLFQQAYHAAPLCHSSGTALLNGLRPMRKGIYGNLTSFRDLPPLKNWVTLPQYFRASRCKAVSGGKIFHQAHGKWSDPESWDEQYTTRSGTPWPPERYQHGMREQFSNKILVRLIDWSPLDCSKEETQDWRTAAAAEDFLRQDHDQPCFLARTIYRPYWSWYTRCEFFELHPRRQIQLPPTLDDDRSDVPARGHVMAWEAPLVAEPMTPWPYPAVVTHSPQWYGVNDAVRSKSFIASGVETAERNCTTWTQAFINGTT